MALLDAPAAARQPDFAVRAAACFALAHCDPRHLHGFRAELVWPGVMKDFMPTNAEADLALSSELLLLALERKAKSAA